VNQAAKGNSVDRVGDWAALIGRRNIAYVVFGFQLGSFGILMKAAVHKGAIPVTASWPR
jgi:hypothetical protein